MSEPAAGASVRPTARTRWLVMTAALLWGLQFSFLSPTLALLLNNLFHATPGQIGWILTIYQGAAFAASVFVPAWADRRHDYVTPMIVCGFLTLALVAALWMASSLPWALLGLVLFGAPAGVGNSMLFAHLKHSGANPEEVVRTRAVVSFAWVAGPPLATLVMGAFGTRSVLWLIAFVASMNVLTSFAIRRQSGVSEDHAGGVAASKIAQAALPKVTIALLMLIILLMQATNSAGVAVLSLYVTQHLHLSVSWAGIVLGVAAGLEVPALLFIGRLGSRVSGLVLVPIGCALGIAFYLGMFFARGPWSLISLQLLNALFYSVVAGVGLALFQQAIPRAGLASGLYANATRLGAMLSGVIIGLASSTRLGYGGVYVADAVICLIALLVGLVALRVIRLPRESHGA